MGKYTCVGRNTYCGQEQNEIGNEKLRKEGNERCCLNRVAGVDLTEEMMFGSRLEGDEGEGLANVWWEKELLGQRLALGMSVSMHSGDQGMTSRLV